MCGLRNSAHAGLVSDYDTYDLPFSVVRIAGSEETARTERPYANNVEML